MPVSTEIRRLTDTWERELSLPEDFESADLAEALDEETERCLVLASSLRGRACEVNCHPELLDSGPAELVVLVVLVLEGVASRTRRSASTAPEFCTLSDDKVGSRSGSCLPLGEAAALFFAGEGEITSIAGPKGKLLDAAPSDIECFTPRSQVFSGGASSDRYPKALSNPEDPIAAAAAARALADAEKLDSKPPGLFALLATVVLVSDERLVFWLKGVPSTLDVPSLGPGVPTEDTSRGGSLADDCRDEGESLVIMLRSQPDSLLGMPSLVSVQKILAEPLS